MGMGAEKSKLHNFNLPPCLKWGNPRLLRCMNQKPNEVNPSPAAPNRRPSALRMKNASSGKPHGSIKKKVSFNLSPSPSPVVGRSGLRTRVNGREKDQGIKVMVDLKEGLKLSSPAPAEPDSSRPWNLRTRQSASKSPIERNGGGHSLNISGTVGNRVRPKFSISLSKQEIEDDFQALIGKRPPSKPKKRPKIVQKRLDSLFPGLWLKEVKAKMYNVPGSIDYKKL
ncbi:uncharacterized protein LOC124909824 [Impatiens glandulifera]|uniref:uncharacterized protein LOC124909824 n=1 Tax=Impatiens glandulifera TaxID=253017 RepID=UPI001FB171F3|nr:uncharacterized protein LOC124909824 [Impatiens glandulifera]